MYVCMYVWILCVECRALYWSANPIRCSCRSCWNYIQISVSHASIHTFTHLSIHTYIHTYIYNNIQKRHLILHRVSRRNLYGVCNVCYCACTYVRMYVCMYVLIYWCIDICISTHISLHLYTVGAGNICKYMQLVYIHTYIYLHSSCTHIHTHIHAHVVGWLINKCSNAHHGF